MTGELFPELQTGIRRLPTTRYQGSKAKLIPWIWENLKELSFDSVLDLFGGSGVFAYWMKTQGKKVTYNDHLMFNHQIGKAIIENHEFRLSEDDLRFLLGVDPDHEYWHFIEETFRNIYYTDEENRWLDRVTQSILRLGNQYERALAFYALFQACLVKRPFNLFHRANLYIRLADVRRNFGNKTTWDRPFQEHFLDFANEANHLVFDNDRQNLALNEDAIKVPGNYDLVYLDPPYTSASGNTVNYLEFYHFLEGLVSYPDWADRIDHRTKNRRLRIPYNPWNDPHRVRDCFRAIFERFRNSILVVSYRGDGIPSAEEIQKDLLDFKRQVRVVSFSDYRYVLSNKKTSEVLFVAE